MQRIVCLLINTTIGFILRLTDFSGGDSVGLFACLVVEARMKKNVPLHICEILSGKGFRFYAMALIFVRSVFIKRCGGFSENLRIFSSFPQEEIGMGL